MTHRRMLGACILILLTFASCERSSSSSETCLVVPEKETTTDGLVLTISTPRTEYREGEKIPLTITLRNAGTKALTLLQPMDGSEDGWSTPIIGWSVLKAGTDTAHPKEPQLRTGGRCGNCNPLMPEDVFVLKPNETMRLNGWCGSPDLPPGDHRLVFYYHNDPTKEKIGLPLGRDDTNALEQMRKSYPCRLMSNEIRLTIHAAKEM